MTTDDQGTTEPPPTGDATPPSVEPLSPPEPDTVPEPVGQPTVTEPDEPKTDQEQGVGIAPTEPGDAGEGNPGTAFQTTEEIEAAQADPEKTGNGGDE